MTLFPSFSWTDGFTGERDFYFIEEEEIEKAPEEDIVKRKQNIRWSEQKKKKEIKGIR